MPREAGIYLTIDCPPGVQSSRRKDWRVVDQQLPDARGHASCEILNTACSRTQIREKRNFIGTVSVMSTKTPLELELLRSRPPPPPAAKKKMKESVPHHPSTRRVFSKGEESRPLSPRASGNRWVQTNGICASALSRTKHQKTENRIQYMPHRYDCACVLSTNFSRQQESVSLVVFT